MGKVEVGSRAGGGGASLDHVRAAPSSSSLSDACKQPLPTPPAFPSMNLLGVGPVPGLGAPSAGENPWGEVGRQPPFSSRGRSLEPCSVVGVWEQASHLGRLWG